MEIIHASTMLLIIKRSSIYSGNAVEGSRTLIQLLEHEPESCAYTNSATTANVSKCKYQRKILYLKGKIKSTKNETIVI